MGVGAAKHTNMNRFTKMMVLAVLLFAGSQLFAQKNVYVRLGWANPTSTFAAGDETGFGLVSEDFTEGGAGMGFTAGLKYKYNFVDGFGFTLSLDGIYNGLNSDVRDWFEDMESDYEEEFDDVKLKTPKYFNVPLMAGFNYIYDIRSNFGIYGEAGIGINFRCITDYKLEIKDSGNNASVIYDYDPTFTFAYQVGAGIEINEGLVVGVSFYNLGSGKVCGKEKYIENYNGSSESESERFKYKRVTPTMVMLHLGLKFGWD